MRLAVFCNNSNMEQAFLERALRHGYDVQAVVPADGRLRIRHGRLTVIQGEFDDSATLEAALTDTHAVVALPGAISNSHMLETVITAMQAHSIARFVVATDTFASSGQPQGFAALLKQANIDWTVVHVASNQDTPQVGFHVSGVDFAKYLVGQITDVTHIGAAVLLRN